MNYDGEPILRADLPHALTNGNDGRGSKWFSSARRRKEIEAVLRVNGWCRVAFAFPVVMRLTRVLGPRQSKWDVPSILCGSAKELIDALAACGWFHDDSPRWITDIRTAQDDTRRDEGPITMVEIWRDE